MSIGFVLWAMAAFDGAVFGICGKTIESLRRNVITQLPTWLEGVVTIKERRNENKLIVTVNGRTNRFYLFGGRDESSYALIQGITLAGMLFDEVALMPRSFVEQAMARCSVEGSKFWFNCNPEGPKHWFYTEWVCKCRKKNVMHLHFTMEDNLSLSASIRRRYEGLYSGVFYDRYILGRWVVAEGLIYPMFNAEFHVVPTQPRPYEKYWISGDYGTMNPCVFLLWGLANGVHYLVDEYYYDGRKDTPRTDEEHHRELEKLAGDRAISRVIIDPSAASFITLIRRKGKFRVLDADNAVIDGIRECGTALKLGLIKFNDCCQKSLAEFGLYRWDEKSTEDKPIKENDHFCDGFRYYVRTTGIAVPKRKPMF